MDLWWKIVGYDRMQLTSADCEARLRLLTGQGIRLMEIDYSSALTVEFSVLAGTERRIRALLDSGDSLELKSRCGFLHWLASFRRYPILLLTAALILYGTVRLQERILFIQVQGNGPIPEAQIIQTAEHSGLTFGAFRRELRSEEIKNRLLYEIPDLSWAGVNTRGCVATITVRPRDADDTGQTGKIPGSLVAVCDAVVTEVSVTSGDGRCVPGQTVRSGQVLVSGFLDLGICTRAVRAEGEIFGITNRIIRSQLPDQMTVCVETGAVDEKYSMIFGKKRINFYSDSGILHSSCGKMREVRWLTLPGGWELPIALVIERCSLTEQVISDRTQIQPILEESARSALEQEMIAGEIITQSTDVFQADGLWVLEGEYQCREMIARLRQGVFLEGDTKDDRENGERGAG